MTTKTIFVHRISTYIYIYICFKSLLKLYYNFLHKDFSSFDKKLVHIHIIF